MAKSGKWLDLIKAIKTNDINHVDEILKDRNINAIINNVDENGLTALAWASEISDTTIAFKLIKMGADVNIADDDGVTPLMMTVLNGNLDLVEELLQKGAKVNKADINGDTALIYAKEIENFYIKNLLLDNGAEENIVQELDNYMSLILSLDMSIY